jgi:hypothetical protein
VPLPSRASRFPIPRRWLAQHEVLERLNLQAHAAASANADDFVLSAVLAAGKLPVLVSELLAVEAWREHVLPALLPRLLSCAGADSGRAEWTLRLYAVLYHEATLVNLLELWLFHEHVVEVRAWDALIGERLCHPPTPRALNSTPPGSFPPSIPSYRPLPSRRCRRRPRRPCRHRPRRCWT